MSEREIVEAYVVANFNAALEEVLDDLGPRRMLQYLAGAGWWCNGETSGGTGQLWTLTRGGKWHGRVAVPVEPEAPDFRLRMGSAVRTVLVAESWMDRSAMLSLFPRGLR